MIQYKKISTNSEWLDIHLDLYLDSNLGFMKELSRVIKLDPLRDIKNYKLDFSIFVI